MASTASSWKATATVGTAWAGSDTCFNAPGLTSPNECFFASLLAPPPKWLLEESRALPVQTGFNNLLRPMAEPRQSSLFPLALIAIASVIVHLFIGDGYGFHRD